MDCESLKVMKLKPQYLIQILSLLALFTVSQFFVACGGPEPREAIIEETEGGLELLEQEFAECEGVVEEDTPQFLRQRHHFDRSNPQQNLLEEQYPHEFSSLDQMYPLRGSFRKSKAEILDIVDRYIWSPEQGRAVKLLEFFDLVLLVNVADRTKDDPENSSAQRMQIFAKHNGSPHFSDWNRIQVWPVSSGRPCKTKEGEKIATPTGVFKFNPHRIYKNYESRLWKAEMYETMFLYHHYINPHRRNCSDPGNKSCQGSATGVAIHGTYKTTALGRRDSGGCIRIYKDNAQCLYETIEGYRSNTCLGGGHLDYTGSVPSFTPQYGEADPDYYNGKLMVSPGRKVLIAIFDEKNDEL